MVGRTLGVHQKWGWDTAGWPKRTKRIFQTIWHHAQYVNWEEKGGGVDVWNNRICFPESQLHMLGSCSSGGGWTFAHPWEAVNQILVFFCLQTQLLLSLSSHLYLNPEVFQLLPFDSPPHNDGWMNEQAAVLGLVAGWGKITTVRYFRKGNFDYSIERPSHWKYSNWIFSVLETTAYRKGAEKKGQYKQMVMQYKLLANCSERLSLNLFYWWSQTTHL